MIRHRIAAIALLAGIVAAVPAARAQKSAASLDSDPRLARPLTIEDCIAIALENNLELRVARLSRDATDTAVDEALGIFYPEFTANANRSNFTQYGDVTWNVLDTEQKFRYGTATMTQTLPLGTRIGINYFLQHEIYPPDLDTPVQHIQAGFMQPLLRGAGWRATTGPVTVARYDTRIADLDVRARELFIVQRVKAAYYEVMRGRKLIDVNQRAIDRDHELLAQSQAKVDAGLATKRDVLSADIILAQDRGTLVDAETGTAEALDQLARILGLEAGAHALDIADKDVVLDSIPIDEAIWVQKAQRDNPTIEAARLAVERNELAMKVAGNARLPQLDVGLLWQRFNDPDHMEQDIEDNILRIAMGDAPDLIKPTGYHGWTGMVTISYPLGNKALGAAHRRARLVHQQSERVLDDVERQVVLDVRTTVRALRNNVERLGILEKNIAGARDKLEFATVNFQLGRASNMDITDAQKDLLDAEVDWVNEVVDYRVQVARLEQLLGGF
jgi:outer membrane protein TolC